MCLGQKDVAWSGNMPSDGVENNLIRTPNLTPNVGENVLRAQYYRLTTGLPVCGLLFVFSVVFPFGLYISESIPCSCRL